MGCSFRRVTLRHQRSQILEMGSGLVRLRRRAVGRGTGGTVELPNHVGHCLAADTESAGDLLESQGGVSQEVVAQPVVKVLGTERVPQRRQEGKESVWIMGDVDTLRGGGGGGGGLTRHAEIVTGLEWEVNRRLQKSGSPNRRGRESRKVSERSRKAVG